MKRKVYHFWLVVCLAIVTALVVGFITNQMNILQSAVGDKNLGMTLILVRISAVVSPIIIFSLLGFICWRPAPTFEDYLKMVEEEAREERDLREEEAIYEEEQVYRLI